MTIITPIKGNATSGLRDLWQSHIQQQQAERSQAAVNPVDSAGKLGVPASAANSAGGANVASATNATGNSDASTDNGSSASRIDTQRVDTGRGAQEGAAQTGKAVSGGADAGSSSNPIVAETIKKLKAMLAKVMAQLDAVRNNDRLPPEDKLQQTTALSAQAMSIQAQIIALMNPTKTSGTRVNTTA
ncbi:hypothetical protein PHO31112_04842 [Pandoraea horticolens]|uniref:Uncharacterized protein n=1 Tax=Pandoraea horticolens TaxID=2508298 RepID=A0A5E4YXU0_9BURK|nr:FlxA-like family protein [Pandoraea horticolens]VVE53268.1 hypothetical protein PHO31112_04842 [Pandoraea horticolens]